MSTQADLDIRPHSEPIEREDPRNRLLDAFEVQVQDLIERGLEPQLRARLERLLPTPAAQAVHAEHGFAMTAPATPSDVEREMALVTVLTALGTVDKFRKAKPHSAQITAAKKFVLDELAALKARRARGNGQEAIGSGA